MVNNKVWLIVGLGNWGDNFVNTRHNAGFLFLNQLVATAAVTWQTRPSYQFCQLKVGNQSLIGVKPTTMMNLSGQAVQAALVDFKLLPDQAIVVCDNVDLAIGTAKCSTRLANSGHNGLKNIQSHLNQTKLKTIHIGVGYQRPLAAWVLSRLTTVELTSLTTLFEQVQTHLQAVWSQTTPFARRFNITKALPLIKPKPRYLVVVGGQFGDEGKGKIVDYYAADFDLIARFSGGDNAGHTVKIDKQLYQFSILPVAMIRPTKIAFLGPGCLINLTKLCSELATLQGLLPKLGQLRIAARAHLILPTHLAIDQHQEQQRQTQIGTTKRGIGPCMIDKVNRSGLQILDLFDPVGLKAKLTRLLTTNQSTSATAPAALTPLFEQLMTMFDKIRPLVVDSVTFVESHPTQSVLFEGAQGSLLDIQYGFYPFVTSTPTLTYQAGLGSGFPVQKATFLGVFKAYLSRVGTGPLPTLIADQTMRESIIATGHEYGVVTGRKRRVGWFDVVLARYAIKINHFHQIALTLLDVLGVCSEIKICTHYLIDGKKYFLPPIEPQLWTKIQPQYITLAGWNQTDFKQIKRYADLPLNARRYVEKIEVLLEKPIVLISIGPERLATLKR